ncbi:hypothetical protein [Rubritalea tangerina]|uniref:hypothetical protein n=1 Tax=Rubritalea tangerina TaxID=430798 RepID=UPI00361C528A
MAYIEVVVSKELIKLTIKDLGPPFNPLELEQPDLEAEIADREVGGLGFIYF